MADIMPPQHRPNYSPERRATALSWIRGEGLLTSDITEDARLFAVVGLLICDDAGRFSQSHLATALADPTVMQVAASLLREARA